MKLLFDILKEFEQHFQANKFEDSLHRLSADAHLLAGLYEQETALMLSEAFKNALVVLPHGDLIDRDKLLEDDPEIHEDWIDSDGYCWDSKWGYTREQIQNIPVIIPAEESSEKE